MVSNSISIAGRLFDFSEPQVMGIINVTPDSFYAPSRTPLSGDTSSAGTSIAASPSGPASIAASPSGPASIAASPSPSPSASASSLLLSRAEALLRQGATMLDVGACSTRPGSAPVPSDEEWQRLDAAFTALAALREAHPDLIISVDTFRADIARRCVLEHGVHIINDISAGDLDPAMFPTVADLRVPYVLTHNPSGTIPAVPPSPSSLSPSSPSSPSPSSPLVTVPGGFPAGASPSSPLVTVPGGFPAGASPSSPSADYLPSVARFFADRLQRLYSLGVTDVILDPGFGFGKTIEQNYALFRHLGDLIRLFPDNPMLVGVSRKSMIWRLLGITPDEALNGTTVLNTLALNAGAHILRVHDVLPAVEAVRLCQMVNPPQP